MEHMRVSLFNLNDTLVDVLIMPFVTMVVINIVDVKLAAAHSSRTASIPFTSAIIIAAVVVVVVVDVVVDILTPLYQSTSATPTVDVDAETYPRAFSDPRGVGAS